MREQPRERQTNLVIALGDHEGEDDCAGEGHGERVAHDGAEGEHLGVHVERGERAGSDDDGRKLVEHGADRERGVEATKLEPRVGELVVVQRLENEREAVAVGGGERAKRANAKKGVELGDVRDLERAEEQPQSVHREL